MTEKLLSISNLAVAYHTYEGRVRAVNGLNLNVEKGQTVGLVGESGAGKTTTALSIMGLIPSPPGRIESGSIVFDGVDLLYQRPARPAMFAARGRRAPGAACFPCRGGATPRALRR